MHRLLRQNIEFRWSNSNLFGQLNRKDPWDIPGLWKRSNRPFRCSSVPRRRKPLAHRVQGSDFLAESYHRAKDKACVKSVASGNRSCESNAVQTFHRVLRQVHLKLWHDAEYRRLILRVPRLEAERCDVPRKARHIMSQLRLCQSWSVPPRARWFRLQSASLLLKNPEATSKLRISQRHRQQCICRKRSAKFF